MVARVVTGNYAAAYGALLAKAEIVAAYPITPQTFIVEHISEFIHNGMMDAEYMPVESEHSAMSACVAAAATGVRTYTATASQGLALMHEVLPVASNLHLPIVMPVVNRTVASPIGIWCEHNDTMPQRDSGWMQVYCEDNQEVLDMIIQAYKIAEDKRVLLPIMVNLDAFILSHTTEPVDFPDQSKVDEFLPKYKPEHAYLRPEDPMILGSFCPPEYIQEIRSQTDECMHNARPVIKEVTDEYVKMFGRNYHGLIEEYRTDDADAILITIGTVTSTAREVVDNLREDGKNVGLAKLRFFRPFPIDEMRALAKKTKALGVYDRSVSFGIGGPAFIEVRHSLYGHSDIPVMNFLAGLGGRDVTVEDIKIMYENLLNAARTKKLEKEILWIGTRGL